MEEIVACLSTACNCKIGFPVTVVGRVASGVICALVLSLGARIEVAKKEPITTEPTRFNAINLLQKYL
jgi:hypothetical protein